MIKKEDLSEYKINSEDLVSIKTMGHIYEICYLQKRNNKITTRLIDKDHYMFLNSGKIKNCKHIDKMTEKKIKSRKK